MLRRCALIAIAGLLPALSWGQDLLRDTSVRKTTAGYDIAFTLAKPTDVTVRIVDADENVVRHLASGMVGLAKAAKPFQVASLSQKILWDGKDDAGKEAPPGCKVTVAVGMSAKFDKFILWDKDACPPSERNHCYTAPNGDVYVNQSSGTHLDTMRLFSAEGRLIRQVWPPSLNRPKAAVQGLLAGKWGATDWDGDGVPIKICHNSWYLVGVNSAAGMALTSDGYLVGRCSKAVQALFYALDQNDYPIVMKWAPPWYVYRQLYKTQWRLAAGDDGDFYVTDNYHHVVGHFRASDMSPIHSFTHNGKEQLAEPRFYLGEKGKAGDDEGHFIGPVGVALGEDGNLHVLEGKFSGYGNFTIEGTRVKVYSKEGKFIKLADKSQFPSARPIPDAVKAVEKAPRALCFPFFLRMGPGGRLMVMNSGRSNDSRAIETDVEGKDLKGVNFPSAVPYNGYNAFDTEGNWYVAVTARETQQVWKFSPDGKRARFGDQDAITISKEGDPFKLTKGICVGPNGDIYVVAQTNKWTQKPPDMTGGVKFGDLSARGQAACQTRVDVYGPDGALKTKGVVKSLGINDVALDREGNIYIIEGTMWHGAQMAQVAKGGAPYGIKAWPFQYLTPEQAKLDPKTDSNKRYSLLSRLVKFSPEGGILDDPAGGRPQLWDYAGVSGVSPWNCNTECPAAQIHIDPDGRIWVPDSFLYCIKAVDTAGNEIIRIGKYGNEDCTGGGGDKRHPELPNVVIDPEIPLSYPKGMAVYKDYLFISDMFAHRVMRCRLEYADTQLAEVK